MATAALSDMVRAANAHLADPALNRVVGAAAAPHFELYHFGLSLCSYKLRLALAEKGIPYRSHDIGILPPVMANYQPDYVRLRLSALPGGRLVDGYSGRSAVTSEGFDPCAVPTLVDHEAGRVLVDSRAILEHLDEGGDGPELIPARHRREIQRQMAIVDATPHVAVLYGAHPDGDFRPKILRESMPGIHDNKIMRLMEARSLAVGDPALTTAYDAKIRKEAAAKAFLRDPVLMRGALTEIDRLIGQLETDLAHGGDWLIGERYSTADLVWTASLYRLAWLGMAFLWEGGDPRGSKRPAVKAYVARLLARPSVREAIIDWPGHPASEFVQDPAGRPLNGGDQPRRANGQGSNGQRSTRDIREDRVTEAVLSTFEQTPNARRKKIFKSLIRHLHAFIEEIEPTEAEWLAALDFLTRTGKLSDEKRQEFILLSDVLGATARVDLINHRFPAGATENSVLGPFFMENRPLCANGDDISGGQKGEPMFFSGRVLDPEGRPVAGARVDIWHSDGIGAYDVMMPNLDEAAMRGLFRADEEGRFWFTSITPTSYPIPLDGTVGELMRATGRSPVRPAHVHVRIEAPGFERLTTMLFVEGDPHLDSDPVFGVKSSLIVPFDAQNGRRTPDGSRVEDGAKVVEHDFVLAKKRQSAP
jgi:hydroxyquinol 1,2-dioxygenase